MKKYLSIEYVAYVIGGVGTLFLTRALFGRFEKDILNATTLQLQDMRTYYHSFLFVAVFAYPAFCYIFLDAFLAVAGSVIYTFLSYHIYANNGDLYLSYALVPSLLILLIFALSNLEDTHKYKKLYFIILQIISLSIGFFSIDYSYIMLILYLVIFVYTILQRSNYWKYLGITCLSLLLSSSICQLMAGGVWDNGHRIEVQNNSQWFTINGISLCELFMPPIGHRLELFRKFAISFFTSVEYTDININMNYIGVISVMGLFVSVLCTLSIKECEDRYIKACGILNIVSILLFNETGLGVILERLGISNLYYYEKAIPCIAFLSITTMFLLFRRILQVNKQRKYGIYINTILYISLFIIVYIALLDQIPGERFI